MKKKMYFLGILAIVLTIAGGMVFATPANRGTDSGKGVFMNKKVLVVYFSWGGNTKFVAERIQSQTGGDLVRLTPKVPYPSDYRETVDIGKKQKETGERPILTSTPNLKNYDVIFVGTPVWWYTMAPPVVTFLSSGEFRGKTIVPFVTHGGGGGYSIKSDMAELAPGSKVLNPLVVYGKGGASLDNEIKGWLKKL